MTLPTQLSLRKTRRLGQVALTALAIGIGGAAIAALPLGNLAFAGNGNGNGGGHGHDGGHGGGNGGGNGGGQGHGGGQNHGGGSGKADKGDTDATDTDADDGTTVSDDDSMEPHNLGKLNGFFHASPNGLANASPNSSIGRISHTFKDALSAFAAANETETDPNAPEDPNATPPTGPSADDLGAILAGATNKTVTSTQVKEIIERLAEQNPDDASLNDLADSVDDETCQDIADAANAAKSGETTDESDDDTTDTSSDGTDADGTDDTTTVVTN